MEYWWTQPLSHDGSVHVHSCARSVSKMQVMVTSWDFVHVQSPLNGIVTDKAIYQKVACALGPFSTLVPFSVASSHQVLSPQPAFFKCWLRKVASSTIPQTQL